MYSIDKGKMSDDNNSESVSRIKTLLWEVAFGCSAFYSAKLKFEAFTRCPLLWNW